MANENRIRYAILPVATLTADYNPLNDTVLMAGEFADYPEITSTAHLPLWVNRDREDFSGFAVEPYLLYGTAHTLGSTSITVAEAPENVIDRYYLPVGCKVHHGMTRRDYVRNPTLVAAGSSGGRKRKTSANTTHTSTTWTNFDTNLDLTIEAYPGDLVQVHFNGLWENQAQSSVVDVATNVGGSNVTWFGSGEVTTSTGDGVPWWFGTASIFQNCGGPVHRVLTSADLSGNTVTVRFRIRVSGSKTMRSQTNTPLDVSIINLGPVDETPVLPTFS